MCGCEKNEGSSVQERDEKRTAKPEWPQGQTIYCRIGKVRGGVGEGSRKNQFIELLVEEVNCKSRLSDDAEK